MVSIVSFLLLVALPMGRATNSSLDECNARPVAGSIFESIRLRGGATSEMTDKNPVVLFLGDSNAEFAGSSLSIFCRGCKVVNMGIGGTFTTDWNMAKLMEVAATLPEGFMPSHVWLSIGGNDYMDRHNCQTSLANQLQAEITEVGSNLRSILPPEVKILMTSYAQTTGEICDYPGHPPKGPAAGVELTSIIAKAAEAFGAVFIPAMNAVGGGTATSFTPESEQTHQDLIHLSNKGYCRLFTNDAVQSFFGCAGGEPIDCESVPVMPVPGVGEAFYGKDGAGDKRNCAAS
jgi:lysophospholipase L1-like esterase